MLILNVVYVLLAIAMIALILMQRGAGAQAGSGFGAGASATVFGARGASNFLSKSTKWLAIAFFAISLGSGWRPEIGYAFSLARTATFLPFFVAGYLYATRHGRALPTLSMPAAAAGTRPNGESTE